MYIQITNRCNMKCKHCCFSCTEIGIDMKEEIFYDVVKNHYIKNNNKERLTIGGGEATLHKNLFSFIEFCLKNSIPCGVVTNGKNKEDAASLHEIACIRNNREMMLVALSLDEYHEPISTEVIELYTNNYTLLPDHFKPDYIEDFGYTTKNTLPYCYKSLEMAALFDNGRAKTTHTRYPNIQTCINERDFDVEPTGLIRFCGCTDGPYIGNIKIKNKYIEMKKKYGCFREVLNDNILI